MISKEFFLVVNLGLKSIRAIVFNGKGESVLSRYIPINTIISSEFVEQDPEEWREKLEMLLGHVSRDKAIAVRIKGLTVTSSSSCLVAVDKEGKGAYNSIMVSDKRARAEAEHISSLPACKKVNKDNGIAMSAYHMLPKILWLKKNQPAAYKRARYFLSPNDYLNYLLTGRVLTDTFNAEKYHFDTKACQYPLGLLAHLKINKQTLPPVEEPGYVIGRIKPRLAARFNLDRNVKVVLSTYDAICAFFGSCPSEEGIACDVSGTVTSVRTSTNKVPDKNLENIFCSFLKNHGLNVLGASNNLGGGLIEWAKQAFYVGIKEPYALMEQEASESTLGARGIIFMPYLLGERAPIWDNDVRGAFVGIERVHTRKDFIRAVFESTAFITNDLIQEMAKNGVRIDKLRISGGLSRINLISQIKADVTGKRVELLQEPETTSVGALFFLLFGMGVYSDFRKMMANFIRVRAVFEPDKKKHSAYNKFFGLYKKLYDYSKDLFKTRKKIMDDVYCNLANSIENL